MHNKTQPFYIKLNDNNDGFLSNAPSMIFLKNSKRCATNLVMLNGLLI